MVTIFVQIYQDMRHQCFQSLERILFYRLLNRSLKVVILLDFHVSFVETSLLHDLKTFFIVSTKLIDVRSSWPMIFFLIIFIIILNSTSNFICIFETYVTETLTFEDFLVPEKVFLLHRLKVVKHEVSQVCHLDTCSDIIDDGKYHDSFNVLKDVLFNHFFF